ncbi:glycoside hydrolase (GH117) [Formosa agariphila KMM 3901]|uniref:Glycoside hydrolase (GH117) n=1 Tax=Formosa agariphila (strain DSM 15362 / KCTC 12365 / LMG 23005 / KMM 3901 / M-2Alg 35-1) TaxID=1347342 RepID=T2KMA1_FORAG|nr:family 43 glycosylhydrolase [Formosa agariphila]CDF79835.1 glycoside hydrolase (GH117) [Formosa agariphila KMM 3901]
MKNKLIIALILGMTFSCAQKEKQLKQEELKTSEEVFPFKMPTEKPNIPLSASSERMFDYLAPRAQDNELFSQFKYTQLKGFDYNNGDGTISRRDPSRPIFVDGKYYIWYTKRHTEVPPIGWNKAAEATDVIPSTDWDLCDIWYATSTDGITWQEKGPAVTRPEKPKSGWRSVATPDILVWKDKYYLYYQAFDEPSGLRGDLCPVSVSYSDSPDGPWIHGGDKVIPFGKAGEWDQNATHDPHPVVYKGKIYIYYKAAYNKWPDNRTNYAVGHGLVIGENPLGPFTKHPLNPVMQSGHETTYFPFKGGIAALAIKDGNERETMQYSEDGVNFKIAAGLSLTPTAAAPFCADAFTDSGNGRGFTWGLSHFVNAGTPKKGYSIIARFDCDLSLDYHEPAFKDTGVWHKPEVYFAQGVGSIHEHPEGRGVKKK